jgi:CubicO group peptidase (beta-lactamase class C family)
VTAGAAAAAGTVAAGFEGVREAFAANLAERGDGGCAFAAVVDGRPVVDLWGGLADPARGARWERGTAAGVFSGTKGIVATLLLLLADRGRLDPERPVSGYWPEFAAAGKDGVTVACLLGHGAGLPAVERELGMGDLRRPEWIAAQLAGQAPIVPPCRPCYHALTWGWLAGELIRRVDGRSCGRMLAEELAGPLGLELAIGARRDEPPAAGRAVLRPAPDYRFTALLVPDPDPRLRGVYANPPLGPQAWNDPAMVEVEIPAANGLATARGLAGMYGALVRAQAPLVAPATLHRGIAEATGGDDPLSGRPLRFGPTGYELAGTPSALGPPADAFGHTGSGGTSHGAWPRLRTGFSFVTADLRPEPTDGRAAALLDALHAAVTG